MKGDRQKAAAALNRPRPIATPGQALRASADGLYFQCPHCGRTWEIVARHGRAAGFVRSGANNHVSTCLVATPAERRAIARLDLARWAKEPPRAVIVIERSHAGFGEWEP